MRQRQTEPQVQEGGTRHTWISSLGDRTPRIIIAVGLCLIAHLALPGSARGQERAEFELAFVKGVPIGELGTRIDRPVWGASFHGGRFLRGTTFSVGVRLTFATYGSDRSEYLPGYSSAVRDGVTYRHDLLTAHLVLRFQPRLARLTPYLETYAGINYFFTQAYTGQGGSVPVLAGSAIVLIPTDGANTLRSSVAPSAGVGAGLKLRLFRFGGGSTGNRSPMTLLLDLQGRYLYGGPAEYLVPGGLRYEEGRLIIDSRRSRTDLFFLSLGLSVRGPFL